MVDEVVENTTVKEVGVHFLVTSGHGNDSSGDATIRVPCMDEARPGSSAFVPAVVFSWMVRGARIRKK